MDKQDLAYQLKYSSSKSIYIVTYNNVLKQLFVPFQVLVKLDIGALKKGQTVTVEGLKVTIELTVVYLIEEQFFFFYHFDIIVEE